MGKGTKPSERDVVVPTGFEPVFKPDYDFAVIVCGL
jgi:hypothetical protein